MNQRLVVREAEHGRRSSVSATKRRSPRAREAIARPREEEHPVSRRQHIDDLNDIAAPEQPALSPDGQEVVYVLRTADAAADRNVTALWRVGSRDGDPERLTAGPADTAPAWSPDGSSVAFLRAGDRTCAALALAGQGRGAKVADRPGPRRRSATLEPRRFADRLRRSCRSARNAGRERRRPRGPGSRATRNRERLDYQADGSMGIRPAASACTCTCSTSEPAKVSPR